ncbi:MAG TPA: lysylphosphatidylglycerol synthase transmembrane domain-containing protein [Blastocatellia bacterium]|nr:lysylphosphatidylglycerol synthase transmembrane domain-containing protein [Blastocatellia bacterium]
MGKKLKSGFILAIGLGLAWWFIKGKDWETVGAHLQNARIWPLLLAAVLINLTIFARSLRWKAFLAPISAAKLSNLFAATAIGFGAIFVIGRAGELIRPAVLSLRERIKPSATFATILIERLYDTTAVVTLFATNLLFFKPPPDQINASSLVTIRSIGLTLLICVVVGISILALLRYKAEPIIRRLERNPGRLPQKLFQPLLNFIRHLAEGLSVLLDLRALAATIFFTALIWAMISAATWLTLFAFGLRFSISYAIFVLGFGLVGSVAPTPGGSAGAFHAAAAKGLEFLGLEANLAASIAIVYHLIAFGPPFVIGLFYLIRDDIGLRQLREMIASETELKDSTQPQGRGDTETERVRDKDKKRRSARLTLYLSVCPVLWLCGSVAAAALSDLKVTGGFIL